MHKITRSINFNSNIFEIGNMNQDRKNLHSVRNHTSPTMGDLEGWNQKVGLWNKRNDFFSKIYIVFVNWLYL